MNYFIPSTHMDKIFEKQTDVIEEINKDMTIIEDGKYKCEKCKYMTNNDVAFNKHNLIFHEKETEKVIYVWCGGDVDDKNLLISKLSHSPAKCIDNRFVFNCCEINEIGEELINASNETGVKLYCIVEIFDSALTLNFPKMLIEYGIKYEIFKTFNIPDENFAINEHN